MEQIISDKDSDQKAIDVLYRISTLSGKERNPLLALEGILDEVMNTFGASSASISLLNADSDKLVIEVERGLSKSSKGFELPRGIGVTGWVAMHGEPLLCPDVTLEERYFQLDDKIRCEMAAPLSEGNRTVGALNVDATETNAFSPADLRLLVLMANEASRVLENMWMIQQLRRKAEQLQTLVLVGQDMAGTRKVEEVLESITREALLLLDCSMSAFFLYESETDELKLHSLQDKTGTLVHEETLNPADSLLGTSLRGHRQVQTRDLFRTEEHHFTELIREKNLHSMLVTPVVYEDEPIGLLTLYVDRSHRYNDDERLIARALADLGAIAIQNAFLYDRVFSSEEILRKSERLTTLGTLAAEIAHEIRNPLMVVRLLFDSLELSEEADAHQEKDLSIIREKLNHLDQIAGRILDFGKSREAFRIQCPMREIMTEAALLVRLKLEQSKVTLTMNELGADYLVFVDKGQIQQALLNLILNALGAMSNGGHLTLETSVEENKWVRVLVKDTGTGIPEEFKNRIFDSFLTARVGGTGLGLTISKRIMRAHDGDLELMESTSQGTVFRLSLPIVN
ncbi:MAG: GAF domain-containing protein [Opitutales bacterium]|jgi:signal transduction histidine kinase|tara:strand:- start:12 stop:1721 length:1710 start_codon:yes stop_codon:yes gene_type:complete